MSNACVLGTGIDLVDNARMRDVIERWGARFVDRVFLPREQAYCETKSAPHLHYAGRFAVKEAVSKAFGTGLGPNIGLLDIEVVRDPESGAPSVRLSEKARQLAASRNAGEVMISLAHTKNYAVAQALLLREEIVND